MRVQLLAWLANVPLLGPRVCFRLVEEGGEAASSSSCSHPSTGQSVTTPWPLQTSSGPAAQQGEWGHLQPTASLHS